MKLVKYRCNESDFSRISGSPIVYWASPSVSRAFQNYPPLEDFASPRKGLATTDNDRFIRFWWEIDFNKIGFGVKTRTDALKSNKKWFLLNKGGEFRKWYGNITHVVNWENDGKEMKEAIVKVYHGGSYTKEIRSEEKYFQDAITWSALTGGEPSFRYSDYGAIFDSAGSSMFPSNDIFYILGALNSCVAGYLALLLNPTLNYGAGTISKIPLVTETSEKENVSGLAAESVSFSKADWNSFEISWSFFKHPLCKGGNSMAILISALYEQWEKECLQRFEKVKENEEKINSIFIDEYKLGEELKPEVPDEQISVRLADKNREVKSLLSYFVGINMGRYSLDFDGLSYAGGTWDPSKYHTYQPNADGIEVINAAFFGDQSLDNRCIALIRKIYGDETFENNLSFVANALGGSGSPRDVISNYFTNDFYSDHLKVFQKRPIYWLFDAGKKNSFKALVYIHRYSPDTLATLRTDYILPLLDRYNSRIDFLTKELPTLSGSEASKITKELEKLKGQFQELSEYEPKIHHLADQHIALNLDDGVKANYEKLSDVLASLK